MPEFNGKSLKSLILVRHGQSAGNVALEAAESSNASWIDIEQRDVDVPLSPLGERQARAAGRYIQGWPKELKPTVLLSSPYVRARQTAELIRQELSPADQVPELILDERLREREFGILDRLTKKGIVERYPNQAELRARVKKFYYRPPGGESWCDVILRLRSVHDTLSLEYASERVLIVCHTVVVLCFRYLLEKLTEAEILEIDRQSRLANCSFTSFRFAAGGRAILENFNLTAPLEDQGEKVTRSTDVAIEKN